MAILSNSRINELYDEYSFIDISFTSEINQSLRVATKQNCLKIKELECPCAFYTSSMTSAKVLAPLTPSFIRSIENNDLLSLRYCFYDENMISSYCFMVQCRSVELSKIEKTGAYYLIHLVFTQRAPNDLVEILGTLLETKSTVAQRQEERIPVTSENIHLLGFMSQSVKISVMGTQRKGLLKDISFGGIKVLVLEKLDALVGKDAIISFFLTNGKERAIQCKIIRNETVVGHDEIIAIALSINQDSVPLEYNQMISKYMTKYSKEKK